ncbi:MAG: LysR family transcriptional regulator [Mariprofundaceae bacterium]|nr:LysR family transcriptional regulator [Mariprofundaceae bacterium]
MTLEQLKYFCAIVEQGSFRAAAEVVFRSQSSLSISIQKLEDDLDVQLFHRESYRPALTEAGLALHQKAKGLLKKELELRTLAQHLAMGNEAEVKLAVSAVVPIEPVIAILNQLKQRYPATRFTLLIENLGGTMERLEDDDADLVITDAFELNDDFAYIRLSDIEFVQVVPRQSAWAEMLDSLTLADLEQETMIVVRDTSVHSPPLSKGLIDGVPQWIVNDFATKQRIMKSGTGWGRMPLHLVHQDIQAGFLTRLTSADFPALQVAIHLVRKKHQSMRAVEQQLWLMLKACTW